MATSFDLFIVNHCLMMIEEDRMAGIPLTLGYSIMSDVRWYLENPNDYIEFNCARSTLAPKATEIFFKSN